MAVPCLEGARLGSHLLPVSRSVSQSTHMHRPRPHVFCAGPWGNRGESELVPGLRGLIVWESPTERTCQVEKLWKPEQPFSPIWVGYLGGLPGGGR